MMKNILVCLILLILSANADFIRDNSKEIVSDTTSKLVWQDNSEAKTVTKNWNDAIKYCEDLIFAGQNDWRLPNKNELLSIVDYAKSIPTIKEGFKNTTSSYYWSSTADASNTRFAWYVDFNGGHTDNYNKSINHYVRCVRGGQ